MTCQHRSIRQPKKGNEDTCILCQLPIIYTGTKWEWLFTVDQAKRRKLQTMYAVDAHTGAH